MTRPRAATSNRDAASTDNSALITRGTLVQQLRALGVREGDTLMPHVSLRALGELDGGPRTLVEALIEATGPAGNLIAFASWRDSPYEETLGHAEVPPRIASRWPAFDPDAAPAYPGFGAINDFIRTHPGAHRSAHPDASMVAIGPNAGWLVASHRLGQAYGPGSPVERFIAMGGHILSIGTGPDAVTALHYAEAVAGIADKRRVTYWMPLAADGETKWTCCSDWDSNGILEEYAAPASPDAIECITRDYLLTGQAAEGRVGKASSRLIDARDIVAFGIAWLETHHRREGEPGKLPRPRKIS